MHSILDPNRWRPRALEKCYSSSAARAFPERRMTIALRRRDFIAAVGGVAAVGAAWPFAARAQQTDRKRRIGALIGLPANDSLGESEVAAFEQALQRLGWIAGRNIEIAYRWAGADSALIQAFAKELVADHPDVLMARS